MNLSKMSRMMLFVLISQSVMAADAIPVTRCFTINESKKREITTFEETDKFGGDVRVFKAEHALFGGKKIKLKLQKSRGKLRTTKEFCQTALCRLQLWFH